MKRLQDIDAKVCWTAAGCLIVDGKVLLVKHKKTGNWLNPGGHVDDDELPHQAAEREFWEETGVKVEAYDPDYIVASDNSEYLPNPIVSNLHWVSQDNYYSRVEEKEHTEQGKLWKKSCEQHLSMIYLVKPVGGTEIKLNEKESDDAGWFKIDELDQIELYDNVEREVKLAFKIAQS